MASSHDAEDLIRPLGRRAPIDVVITPFRWFSRFNAASGIVLLLAAVAALLWANSSAAAGYHHLWHETRAGFSFAGFEISGSLEWWINDLLMAVFFLLVGMEIKRELLVGELASFRRAATPIAAAIGGMVVPAAIYFAFNAGSTQARGWGVPMATDIAFALGVLAAMGSRAPASMRVFLASLAIIDDLGALLVIAIFYTSKLNYEAMAMAGVLLTVLMLGNLLGIRRILFYLIVGLVMWHYMHESGIHATIAGVLVAATIPARTRIDADEFTADSRRLLDAFASGGGQGSSVITNSQQQGALAGLESNILSANAPLVWLEHNLVLPVNFLILPVFALANAGVSFTGGTDGGGIHWDHEAWGIALGLLIGKPVGIVLATWLAVKVGIGSLAPELTWHRLIALGCLGGIGFTMALFIAHLAFPVAADLATAKAAVLVGSFASAIIGVVMLLTAPRPAER